MAKTKITAPMAAAGEVTGVGGLVFTDGVAETDDPAIIAYCENAGYGIGGNEPTATATEVESIDPRDAHKDGREVVGSPARDAAVDPQPEDYLPPVNAGKADPHGPLVVAPEIHASGIAPLVPGVVTEAREIEAAKRVRVDGENVHDATEALAGDNTGPLDLSDPSSGEFADTGVADSDGAVSPEPAKTAPPRKSTRSRKADA